jgi:hypothetical protein
MRHGVSRYRMMELKRSRIAQGACTRIPHLLPQRSHCHRHRRQLTVVACRGAEKPEGHDWPWAVLGSCRLCTSRSTRAGGQTDRGRYASVSEPCCRWVLRYDNMQEAGFFFRHSTGKPKRRPSNGLWPTNPCVRAAKHVARAHRRDTKVPRSFHSDVQHRSLECLGRQPFR